MDLSGRIAGVVSTTTFDDLSEETVLASKMAILDTIGVMIAGSGAGEGVGDVVGLLEDLGGAERCSVIGFGKKSNPVLAAMANGALAHSIDYDDAHDDAFVHPSASVVPAALTVGEFANASGRDLVRAVSLGNDVMCRLGFAVSNPEENGRLLWMLPVLLGTFSATVAASAILGLTKGQVENALGIAYGRAGGSKELVIEPGALRGLYAMYPNMTGVLSALLARNGVPGLKETFEGKAGFFNMYYAGVFDESAFDGLGDRFEGEGVSIKPWPCCRFTNSHVDAALQIAQKEHVDPRSISRITLYYAEDETKRCLDPLDLRRNPQTIPEAKLSLPFTVAQALAYRKVEIGDFGKSSLSDPVLKRLCSITFPEYDESLKSSLSKTMLPGRVLVETDDGAVYDKRVDVVYGHPRNRMKWSDLAGKFRDCASFGKKRMNVGEVDEVIDMIGDLEKVEDVSRIMDAIR